MTSHDEHRGESSRRDPLSAYAALLRVPNLFTAPPDVLLGAALVAALGYDVALPSVAGVALASMLLYGGGTTLNDYADRAEDARRRPERPIPASEVAASRALALGVLLLLAGVGTATVAAGPTAGAVAAVVAALIACYDGALKDSLAGFLCMGATRGANVLLGTAVAVVPTALPALEASVPVAVALYVAGITFMAEFETDEVASSRLTARTPVVVAGLGAAIASAVAIVVGATRTADSGYVVTLVLLTVFLTWIGRPLRRAYRDPAPDVIGPAVGACVLGLVLFDAAVAAATAGVAWGLATAAFLLPAVGLSRAFDVS